MSNVLTAEKRQQVLALGRLGWSLRRIEEATGVRRETASSYLKAAGLTVRGRGRPPARPAKPAISSEVSTDSSVAPAAGPGTGAAAPGSRERPSRAPRASACEPYCFMCGLRNYLAHHWTRGHVHFAISGGRWESDGIWIQDHDGVDGNRGHLRTYDPHVTIAAVSKALKPRRQFDASARALGGGAPRINLVPVVNGYMKCLSAHCEQ